VVDNVTNSDHKWDSAGCNDPFYASRPVDPLLAIQRIPNNDVNLWRGILPTL